MSISRDVLYNPSLSAEDAVLALMGLPVNEGIDSGDLIEVVKEDVLYDVETGISVPVGHYSVTGAANQLVHIVQYNPARQMIGGKEYTIHAQHVEECILANDVIFIQHIGEGRYRGSVTDPREIRAMFVKGYLKKKDRPGGGTDLKYARRSFKNFQSGSPNPEYPLNRRRQKRAAERRRRRGIKAGTRVVRSRARGR